MNRLMRRYPSPSLVVSITALVVALGGASYSATGGNFILGRANTASTNTMLAAPLNGRALQVNNPSAAANATALGLAVAAGHPPMVVNSAVKVANLNADRLDGFDSTQFSHKTIVSYNIAPGTNSGPIALPANRPVLVMGVNTTSGYRGVGPATLLRVPGNSIQWIGLEQPSATITSGSSGVAGTHIVSIDGTGLVDIEVHSADTIHVYNGNGAGPQTGTVTLIW